MTDQLREFLHYYIPEADITPFMRYFHRKDISKNEHLLSPDENCNYLAYIQNGCFRVYHYDMAGKEIITWFSFTDMIITDLLGFYSNGKALFFVEALEDSTIYKISKNDLEGLYAQFPQYQEFGRKFAEEALTMLMQRTMSLHTKSAEERYMELLQLPGFMQKIPLKYLASYLGITDTSLSRIRKRIR